VKIKGSGKGGRNMEFVLECAACLDKWEEKPLLFASIGTDGTDGPTDAAGARVTPLTLARAREQGLSIKDYLKRNDSYNFFKPLGDLIVTGPTRTNVMDLHIVLIG
jgi:hydroxypyruvate reductase